MIPNSHFSEREVANKRYSLEQAGLFGASSGTFVVQRLSNYGLHELLPASSFDNPALHFLTSNCGDIGNAFCYATLGTYFVSKMNANGSPAINNAIGAGLGTAAVLIAEVPQLNEFVSNFYPHVMLGTADYMDIPMGLVGVGLGVAYNVWRSRRNLRMSNYNRV